MTCHLVPERETDLLANSSDITQIKVAVDLARGAYADEGQVRFLDGSDWVLYRAQPVCLHRVGDYLLYVRLDDWGLAGIDEVDFCDDPIYADHFVPILRET